jgi:hypothetical protein
VNRRSFDDVTLAEAEAIGPPGQRRFRMIFATGSETAYLWLEKQQLQAIGMAFEQILTHLQAVQVSIQFDGEPVDVAPPVAIGAHEYQVGRLAVGYDEENGLITILAHEGIEEDEEDPDFVARITPDQSGELAMKIRRVVNAGARQRSNGHFNQA